MKQHAFKFNKIFSKQIKEYKRGDYSVMFGPSNDALLDGFISIAQANKLPLINYRITDSIYADTVRMMLTLFVLIYLFIYLFLFVFIG